jgi:hypothetical protein
MTTAATMTSRRATYLIEFSSVIYFGPASAGRVIAKDREKADGGKSAIRYAPQKSSKGAAFGPFLAGTPHQC